jgi:hypothetical protein
MSIWKTARIGVVGLAALVMRPACSFADPVANPQVDATAKSVTASEVAVSSAPRAAQIEPMVAPVKREAPVVPENKAKSEAANKLVRAGGTHVSAKPLVKSVRKKRR